MTSSLETRAEQLRAELDAVAGITAVTDPAHLSANLPCVLVAPPTITWGTLSGGASEVSWRIVVVGSGLATLSAVRGLWELLELVSDVLPLESAEPGTYQVGTELVACYVATFRDNPTTWT